MHWMYGLLAGLVTMNGILFIVQQRHSSDFNDPIRQHQNNFDDNGNKDSEVATLSMSSKTRDDCAQWIPLEKRKVLFVELHRWNDYYGPSKYKTGEYYASATWDYALRNLGFHVDRVSTKQYYERMDIEEIKQYHRIFVRDPRQHRYYNMTDIICKVRPMYFFGDWFYKKNEHNYRFQYPFSEKQIFSANPDSHNTFIGYFPHNLLLDYDIQSPNRGKVGLLYGKKPEYFQGYQDLIVELLSQGFELHTTCKDSSQMKCPIPIEVIRHDHVAPEQFAIMMRKYSFMIGFKQPCGSPSPLVGMSYGVAFLNPLRESGGRNTQHKALSRIGFPYTYVVDLKNISQVVQSAEWASRYRFHSYVPPQYRIDSVVSRICTVLEEDSLCSQ